MVDSILEGIGDILKALFTAAVLMVIVLSFWYLALWLTPKNSKGEKNKGLTTLIFIGVVWFTGLVFDAAMSAPSHPSLGYSPQEYRELVRRKCIFQEVGGSWLRTYCTNLDSPDLPAELQGWLIRQSDYRMNAMKVLDNANIPYHMGNITVEGFFTNDPKVFSRPPLEYKTGHRPDNALLRFWETKDTSYHAK